MKETTVKNAHDKDALRSSSNSHSIYPLGEEPKLAVRRRLTVKPGESARGLDISLLGVTSQLLAEYLTEDIHRAAANFSNQSTTEGSSKLLVQYQRCKAKVDFLEQVGYKLKDCNEQLWCLCKQLESNQTLLLAALNVDDEAFEIARTYRLLPGHNDCQPMGNKKEEDEIKMRFKELMDKRNGIRSSLTVVQCDSQLFGGSQFQQWSATCSSVPEEQLRLENAILLEELYAMKENVLELKNEISCLKEVEATIRLSMQCQEEEMDSLRLLLDDQRNQKANAKEEDHCSNDNGQDLAQWKKLSFLLNVKRNCLLEQNLRLIEDVKRLKNEKASARQHVKAKYRRRLFKLQEAIANLSRQFEDQLNVAKSGRFVGMNVLDNENELLHQKHGEDTYTEIEDGH
uniref:Harmonin-binding protein USHBP1 PDZ-binding domain-containing protein n=1 Tax=Trichuris muris TaxID=70415 RepID=A0A5S6R3K3_TRIMR